MIARGGLATGPLGTYSELIVTAAFLAEGCDVAFPLRNQRAWDLVVREAGWSLEAGAGEDDFGDQGPGVSDAPVAKVFERAR
jgi:hypothetical protein